MDNSVAGEVGAIEESHVILFLVGELGGSVFSGGRHRFCGWLVCKGG